MEFNKGQLEAIEHEKGPCLVSAVAGSGKTSAIVQRIKRLIEKGVPANSILATTFTRRAAREMNERLTSLGVKELKVGTFHSVCYSILREDGKKFGGKYRVRGELPLTKSLLQSLGLPASSEEGGFEPSTISAFISWCKNWLIAPNKVKAKSPPIKQYMKLAGLTRADVKKLKTSYLLIERYRKQAHFLTYDDILYQCHRLFTKKPEVLKKWHKRFRFIIVDEVQDNCFAQHSILRLLASPENNVMIVGDLAQSIYSWRAASPQFMIDFPTEFAKGKKGTKVVKMEENYRSRPEITETANLFMTHAKESLGTKIRPTRPKGGAVFFNTYRNPLDEAMAITLFIKQQIRMGTSPSAFAVICRVNRMMEDFQIAFTKMAIPFKIIGGLSLYEYKVSQDLLAYLQYPFGLTKGVDDKDAFYRLMNTPPRGLGDKFMGDVMVASASSDLPTYKVAATLGKGAVKLSKLIDKIVKMTKRKTPAEILKFVLKKTKYIQRMGRRDERYQKFLEDKSNALMLSAAQFRRTKKFLEHVEEVMLSGGEEEKDDSEEDDKVIIITVHRAKGLEFENVFIPQMTSDRFPHIRAVSTGMIEEERRLFYVAVTRAKETLRISTSMDKGVSGFIEDAGLTSSHDGLAF